MTVLTNRVDEANYVVSTSPVLQGLKFATVVGDEEIMIHNMEIN